MKIVIHSILKILSLFFIARGIFGLIQAIKLYIEEKREEES